MCCTSWRQRLMSHSYKSNWFSWIWKIEGWREINPKDLRKCSKVNTFRESKLWICTIFGFHLVFGESNVLLPTVAFTLATPRGGCPAWHQTSVLIFTGQDQEGLKTQLGVKSIVLIADGWGVFGQMMICDLWVRRHTHTHNPHRHFRNNTNPYLNPRMIFFF